MDIKSAIIAGAIQLTSLEVGESPNIATSAVSYDGVSRNVERFYQPKNTNIKAGVRIHGRDKIVDVYVDTGHDTQKLNVDPTLKIGYHNDKWSITGSVGGNVKHTSCKDSYNREYYCKDLTAWSDFKESNSNENSIFIRRTYRW